MICLVLARSHFMKKWFLVFILSFSLNWLWENFHSNLYVHFQGGQITPAVLLYASLVDALIITAAIILFRRLPLADQKIWFLILALVAISIFIEWRALLTNRWAYNNLMPIIPWLKIGLTPTIQLGLTGYLTHFFFFRKN